MRLWSIHPEYLDSKGLVALWRETLLAKKVLQNRTVGYRNHPQLIRFKNHSSPVEAIDLYLKYIFEESLRRGFNFDRKKTGKIKRIDRLEVTTGQIAFEFDHLKKKLYKRDIAKYHEVNRQPDIKTNPLFILIPGNIEDWEIR